MMKDEEIIQKQRSAFKNFMHEHNLKALPWAKKAGISEATIRNYINGLNQSLTGLILEKLAACVNVSVADLIGSNKPGKNFNYNESKYKFNQEIFIECFTKAEELVRKSSLSISSEERAKILLALYELSNLQKEERDSENIEIEPENIKKAI